MRIPRDDSEPASKEAGLAATGRDLAVPLSKNKHLLKWVEKMARLTLPADIHWVDGSREEYEAICADGRGWQLHQAQRGLVAGLLLRALRPERRREGRGSHVHLLALEGGGRPHQ